ncbi:MAG: S8 family serine peptidase [Actinomycetota bacterium]|nr:S8 family serine peptidase [Actinomycetota bacterium]
MAALSLGTLTGLLAWPVPAGADGCLVPKGIYASATPWAQRQLDLTEVAPLSIGAGQRIAVIGTGIDATNAQFAQGQVQSGSDLKGGSGLGDCDGRGTLAAGFIGAQPDPHTTIVGVAPGAQLVPIRYTASGGDSQGGGVPAALATAFDAAVAAKVDIILVAVPVTADSPALRTAVAQAQHAGIVVVSPAAAAKAGETTYPTSYSGVVAVAGVRADGTVATVESGSYLALSAPGNDLDGLAAGAKGGLGHLWPVNDPSYAAAFVAGVIADVASYLPKLSPAQAVQRVLATAGASDGSHNDQTGWGLVDPIRALTAALPAAVTPQSMAAGQAPAHRVTVARPVPPSTPKGRSAGYLAGGGLLLALLIGLAAATIRRGQRRGWRPARARVRA